MEKRGHAFLFGGGKGGVCASRRGTTNVRILEGLGSCIAGILSFLQHFGDVTPWDIYLDPAERR